MEIAKLLRIAPEIPVSDLEEAVESYEQRLEFLVAMQMPEPRRNQEETETDGECVGDK